MSDYERYIDDLNKLLLSKSVSSLFNDEERKCVKSVIGLMNFHIYKMVIEEDIVDDYENKIKDVTFIIVDKVLNANLNYEMVAFCSIFSEIVYNWNENYKKDILLSKLCLLLNKFLSLYNSHVNLLKKSKTMFSLFSELNSWTPPSFELNSELLQKLLQEAN